MEGLRDTSKRLYQAFHDWRVRLYNDLGHIDTDYLQALRGDLADALTEVEQELATRPPATVSNDATEDYR